MPSPSTLFGKVWNRVERVALPFLTPLQTISVGDSLIRLPVRNPLFWIYRAEPRLYDCVTYLAASVEKWRPGSTLVDVGANVGDTLAYFRSGSNLPILCVEGDEEVLPLLEENARRFEQVRIAREFLSDREETLPLRIDKKGWNGTLLPGTAGEGHVRPLRLRTLDALDASLNIGPVGLVKTDAEGYDMKILRGARNLLERDRPVLLFEFNPENLLALGEDPGAFHDYLAELGYVCHVVFDPFGNLLFAPEDGSKGLWLDLFRYAGGPSKCIGHFDICAFHRDDRPKCGAFVAGWRERAGIRF